MQKISATERIAEAEKFFNLLFGHVTTKHFGYLWTKQGDTKKTYPFDVSTADNRKKMAELAIELNDKGADVYVGVNCGDEPPAQGCRYDAENVTLQTATVTDVDVEGGKHTSSDKKSYPPTFDVAKSFLPFDASFLVNSGYGLHGYCLYREPIIITADNRDEAKSRNIKFIAEVRRKAERYSGAVDGVGDLARVLRVPGTRNYKLGVSNDAPFCHVVEVNDIQFTPADFDEKIAALKPTDENLFDDKKSARADTSTIKPKSDSEPVRQSQSFSNDEPTELDRLRAMLDVIPVANMNYDEWLQIGMAIKNEGGDISDWEQWSHNDDRWHEGECEKKWHGFNRGGLTIRTIHAIAKDFGYSEKNFQREWHATRRLEMRKKDRGEHDVSTHDEIGSLFAGNASDLQFAYRLEKFCGDRVKWCDQIKRWYTYDNGVWTRGGGENSAISHFGRKLADTLNQGATNKRERELADKFQSAKKIGGAINLLKSCDSIRITLDDLDRHGELLNCLNGVVDLQTGKFYDSTPEMLLTRQCRADYQANAQSELMEKFLADIMPDEMTRAGLLRWLGYCLTSMTNADKFAIWTGVTGANGKGCLGGTLLELLGTYGTGLSPRALLKNNRPADANAATTSLNALEGVRFALAEELPLNAELDSSLVKNLSGGDKINLRLNFGEFRTVPNIAKINISGNFAPRIENVNDGGIRRRMLNFAFNVQFGTKEHPADPLLKQKLILPENLRGLLSLLVREAVAYYNGGGLIISPLMKQETQRHLDESNFVADFIGDFFVKVPTAEVKAKDFIDALKAEYPRECAQFNKRADLIKLVAAQDGVTYGKGKNNVNVFKGIGKAAQDNDFDGKPIGTKMATPY